MPATRLNNDEVLAQRQMICKSPVDSSNESTERPPNN